MVDTVVEVVKAIVVVADAVEEEVTVEVTVVNVEYSVDDDTVTVAEMDEVDEDVLVSEVVSVDSDDVDSNVVVVEGSEACVDAARDGALYSVEVVSVDQADVALVASDIVEDMDITEAVEAIDGVVVETVRLPLSIGRIDMAIAVPPLGIRTIAARKRSTLKAARTLTDKYYRLHSSLNGGLIGFT